MIKHLSHRNNLRFLFQNIMNSGKNYSAFKTNKYNGKGKDLPRPSTSKQENFDNSLEGDVQPIYLAIIKTAENPQLLPCYNASKNNVVKV